VVRDFPSYIHLSPHQAPLTRCFSGGKPFSVEQVTIEDLQANELKTTWTPAFTHPSMPKGQEAAFAKVVTIGVLLGGQRGVYDVSDEWNKLLPEIKFTGIEEFLTGVWKDKP
jgi:hypothetical protein